MNDKQIQAFLAICEEGSMNKAAEKLYITQPALKKRIDTLEDEVGTVLLMRTNGGCVVTQAGQVFLEGIKPIDAQMTTLLAKTRGTQEKKVFKVCALPDISMETQDALLLAFAGGNPDVIIDWVRLPTSQWLDAVADGKADMGSCLYVEGDAAQFQRDNICFQPGNKVIKVMCVLSERHPLAAKKRISTTDLRGCQVYAGPMLYGFGRLGKYAEKKGLTVYPDDDAGKRYRVIENCEKGAVYMHVGDYADNLRPLAVRPFNGFTCRGGWIWRKESSELAERFLRYCGAPV